MKKSLFALTLSFALSTLCCTAQTEIRGIVGDTLRINLSDVRGEITWQSSLDSLSWTNIQGENSQVLVHIPSTGASWVRALINEQNCPPFIEGPVTLFFEDTLSQTFDPEIIVMDTVQLVSLADSVANANGTFQFTAPNNNPEDVLPGDYIIGLEDAGYLRKVDSWVWTGDTLTLSTSQATMNDVVGDAVGSFTISADSLESRNSGFSYTFSQTPIGSLGPLSLTINSGSVNVVGDYTGELQYSIDTGFDYFNFSTNNLVVTANSEFEVTAQGAMNVFTDTVNLATYSRLFYFQLGYVPVVGQLKANLLGIYSANAGAELNVQGNLTSSSNISMNIDYSSENGWSPQLSVNSMNELTLDSPSGQADLDLNLIIQPNIELSFYNLVVPYVKAGLNTSLTGTVSSPDLNWDIQGSAFLNAEIGVKDIQILSETIASFSPQTFQTSSISVKTPYEIEIVSGNEQTGEAEEQLTEPLKVRVKNQLGLPQTNVPVRAEVISGDGSLDTEEALTDENGEAQFLWTLGQDPDQSQELEISAKDGSNEELINSPLSFTAEIRQCGDTTVEDIDGNVYETVAIGDQCWFKSNLRTTTFSDGTPIYNGNIISAQTYGDWISVQDYPQYTAQYGINALYGYHYNYLCALDSRNVCPTGWHAATYSDAVLMISYLGGSALAAPKLMDISSWSCPAAATNESGFSALPSGYIWADTLPLDGFGLPESAFAGSVECIAGWWLNNGIYSSSGNPSLKITNYSTLDAPITENDSGLGYSIRCVKDN